MPLSQVMNKMDANDDVQAFKPADASILLQFGTHISSALKTNRGAEAAPRTLSARRPHLPVVCVCVGKRGLGGRRTYTPS